MPSLSVRLRKTLLYLQFTAYILPVNCIVRLFVLYRRLFGPDNLPRRTLAIRTPAGHKLRVYLYAPETESKSASSIEKAKLQPNERRPVHINFHGGGFCFPLHGMDARFCHLISRSLDCWVVDASYRLTPGHPFPAAYEDTLAVLDWVKRDELGVFDTERITVGGFSAGGNLALALTATTEKDAVKGVVAFYPIVDLARPYAEKPTPSKLNLLHEEGGVIPPSDGERMVAAYTLGLYPANEDALKDPRLSPGFADPARFPDRGRTMLLSCEWDYLAPETQEMAQRLEAAGRDPVAVHVMGRGHSWDGMAKEGSEGAKVRDEMWGKAVEVIGRAQTMAL